MPKLEEKLKQIFLEDKDITSVSIIRKPKEEITRSILANIWNIDGINIWVKWDYYNHIVIVEYGEV